MLRLLSPTDSVKDRLMAYYHWKDRQSPEQAVLVASSHPVDMAEVRRWLINDVEMLDQAVLIDKQCKTSAHDLLLPLLTDLPRITS